MPKLIRIYRDETGAICPIDPNVTVEAGDTLVGAGLPDHLLGEGKVWVVSSPPTAAEAEHIIKIYAGPMTTLGEWGKHRES